jgi:hypothetical protein
MSAQDTEKGHPDKGNEPRLDSKLNHTFWNDWYGGTNPFKPDDGRWLIQPPVLHFCVLRVNENKYVLPILW